MVPLIKRFCKATASAANTVRTIFPELLNTYAIESKIKVQRVSNTPLTAHSYFISSDAGLYLFDKTGILQLLSCPCFGICIANDHIFVSCFCRTKELESRIVAINLKVLLPDSIGFVPTFVYKQHDQNVSTRIHQIHHSNGSLYIANTGHNSILQMTLDGRILRERTFILDEMQCIIDFDHNHINSVFVNNGITYFTCFRAGDHGLVGIMDDDQFSTWKFGNKGIHDIIISAKDVFISNSFGERYPPFTPPGITGMLTKNGEPYHPEVFPGLEEFMVRGYCEQDGEELIGLSAYWDTEVYSKHRHGGLIIIPASGNHTIHKNMPWNQVYDVIALDGTKTTIAPAVTSYEQASESFCKYFGNTISHGLLGPRTRR